MTENDAINGLLNTVDGFIWYPAPNSPDDPASGITEIDFGQSDVSDEELAYLQHLPQIKWICLEDTAISNYGLTNLSDIVSLRHLDLQGTNVTEDGVAKLRAALPQCNIEW